MGKKCQNPDCGFDGNEPAWEFCGHCGADLAIAPEAVPTPQVDFRPSPPAPEPVAPVVEPQPGAPAPPPPVRPVPAIKAKLVVTQTGRVGQVFPITKELVNIGRWDADSGAFPEIDLTQDDPGSHISRKHARIFFKDGKYFIEDLGSTNGTFVNRGHRLAPHSPQELNSGDEVVMGRTFFTFLIE